MAKAKKFSNLDIKQAMETANQHTQTSKNENNPSEMIDEKEINPSQPTEQEEKNESTESTESSTFVDNINNILVEKKKKAEESNKKTTMIHIHTTPELRNWYKQMAVMNEISLNQMVGIVLQEFKDTMENQQNN